VIIIKPTILNTRDRKKTITRNPMPKNISKGAIMDSLSIVAPMKYRIIPMTKIKDVVRNLGFLIPM
jgi:hypothetical protein